MTYKVTLAGNTVFTGNQDEAVLFFNQVGGVDASYLLEPVVKPMGRVEAFKMMLSWL